MYTQPIEAGGDAIKKWVYVVNFWEKDTNTLENHHTMRWAVNLPGVALVTAMGSKPTVYYLLPLSAFSVGVVLLCSIARRRLSVTAMAALVIFLFLEPMMHRASTQFQPIAFGFAYLAASLWFLLAWEQQKQTRHLVVSAVFLFLAYGAKVPYAYFLPGILFFVFASGGLRPAIIWTVAFAFFFNVEALAFNTISDRDLPLGRLSAILSTHNPETGFNHSRYIEYFLMWTKVSWFNQIISILSLGPAILYVLNRKSKSLSPELLLQCLCLTSYHILNTFLVVNFETLMTPQPPEQKYLAVTMPFACLASVLWFHQLSETYRTPRVDCFLVAAAAALLFGHVFFDKGPKYWHNGLRYPSRTGMMYKINSHYEEGAIWLKEGHSITTNYPDKVKALKALLLPFLPEKSEFIVEHKDGQFFMRLEGISGDPNPQVSKYWFSQADFARIVDPPTEENEPSTK